MGPVDISTLHTLRGKRVALQFPEGMRRGALELAERVRREVGCTPILLGGRCYGACDLPGRDALERMRVDALVHLGHAGFTETPPRIGGCEVVFLETRVDIDLTPLFELLGMGDVQRGLGGSVALATTVQHVHQMGVVAAHIRGLGMSCEVRRWGARSLYPGQVVGCSFSGVDALPSGTILYVGTGLFHPLGLSLATRRPVFRYDPESGHLEDVGPLRDRCLRLRSAAIERARGASWFGVIVSTKPGQSRIRLAERITDDLVRHGRRSCLIVVDEVRPEDLDHMGVDAWVSTACPRIAFDDAERFDAPILTPPEVDILLGRRTWEDYVPDTFG